MPLLLFLVTSAGVAWLLKDHDEAAVVILLGIIIWTVVLFVSPALAGWLILILLGLGVLAFAATFWVQVLGIMFGLFICFMIFVGLLAAAGK